MGMSKRCPSIATEAEYINFFIVKLYAYVYARTLTFLYRQSSLAFAMLGCKY